MGENIAKKHYVEAMSKRELEKIFNNLSKEQLLEYIIQLSEDFEIVNSFFQLEFAPMSNISEHSCNHMIHYINSGMVDGKIPSQNVRYVIQGGEQVLEKANKCIVAGQSEQAALFCVAVLSCYIPILSCSDDQVDAISFLIDRCITSINNVTLQVVKKNLSSEEKNNIYSIIKNEALNSIYDNWIDWRADLLAACVCLAEDDSIRTSLYETVDEIIEKSPNNRWYKKYVTKRLKEIIYNVIKMFDGTHAAQEFVNENLDYDNFRDIAVNFSLEKKDYKSVVELCTNIENMDKIDPNRQFKWKNDLLSAYVGLDDTENQKIILEDFVIQGKTEYFDDLKLLFPQNDWEEELELIIGFLQEDKSLKRKYLDILIKESKQQLMVEYCKENPEDIIYTYNSLSMSNKKLLHNYFEKYVFDLVENSSGRSDYKKICDCISDMEKKCNKSLADEIVIKLQQTYNRKTAFVEELNSVLYNKAI